MYPAMAGYAPGMLLLLPGTLLAQTITDGQLSETLAAFNAAAHTPLPELDAGDRQRLLAGEVIKVINPRPDGTLQVAGLLRIQRPLQDVWIAGQDPHFASPGQATELRMEVEGDRASWYGFLDLPRPVTDRHWVVDVWNNHDLAAKSGNTFWEHPWTLDERGPGKAEPFIAAGAVRGITTEMAASAIYTPVNSGAWVFIALPDGTTLLSYHATSVVGGNIPDRLVAEFIRMGLEELLRRVERIAAEVVRDHYTPGHFTVLGGDGQPVAFY
jgi:hypothetical protein